MDTKTRAEKIYQQLLKPDTSLIFGDPISFIQFQLDEAQLEVLEQNEVLVKIRIDEAVREAEKNFRTMDCCEKCHKEGFAAAWDEFDKKKRPVIFEDGFKKGTANGFHIARKKAAGIAEETCPDENYGDNCHESIPRRIRAMEAGT